jgi:protease IV
MLCAMNTLDYTDPIPPRRGPVRRFFGGIWWLLNGSRRLVFNLLWLLLLVGLVWWLIKPGVPSLQDKTALILDLKGPVVEQKSGGTRDSAIKQLQGQSTDEVPLRDVLAVLEAAAKDPKITHAVLLLDDFGGAGLATLRELGAAIERFKASGKKVTAWGSGYDQRIYYLAAHADEVFMHPMGFALFEGFGRQRIYYKALFDKVGVTPNVLRVGQFKSFGEVYSNTGPSPEATEAEKFLFDALWKTWSTGVEKARKLPEGAVKQSIDALPGSLMALKGDVAQLAVQQKFVDGLKTRDELRALMVERGAADDEKKSFRQVAFNDYLKRIKPNTGGDAIGIVVAEGGIGDGEAPAGSIGGVSTAALVRKAREDDKIKAVVLRVDSPGGSAFASELIRRELELTKKAGKPVVVSMGDVAASGGYWISMAADEIIADEGTVTGSIGVVAFVPTVERAMEKIGINRAGYTTTWLAGAMDLRQALDPRIAQMVQSAIEHTYAQFIGKAAETRKTTPDKIDAVGQGRVWTGAQAVERGLVDRTGSFGDAIKAAAARAKLAEGTRIEYIEKEPGRLQRLLAMLGGDAQAAAWVGRVQRALVGFGLIEAVPLTPALALLPPEVANELRDDLGWLAGVARQQKPFAAVVHCLCTAP